MVLFLLLDTCGQLLDLSFKDPTSPVKCPSVVGYCLSSPLLPETGNFRLESPNLFFHLLTYSWKVILSSFQCLSLPL